MKRINLKQQDGFTLIEVSVMILILSFILIPMFNFLATQRMQKERIEAESINERLLSALSIYLKENGSYPCPANPALDPGDANFAKEQNCASLAGTVVQGDIPTYSLGIPYHLMLNSDDYRYIYAVTKAEVTGYTGGGAITVNRQRFDPTSGTLVTTTIPNLAFVVVNPGEDGKGGSGPFACGTSAKDSENCDGDAVFRDYPYSKKISINDGDYYDDLIFYDLAREESTFWTVRQNATDSSMNIVNRNAGNIGIGDYTTGAPTEKFEVKSGDVRVDTGDLKAEGKVKAPEFYYP